MLVYFNETFSLTNEHCFSFETFINFNIIMIVAMLIESFQNIHKILDVKIFQYKRSFIFQCCIKFENILLGIWELQISFLVAFFFRCEKIKFFLDFTPPFFDLLWWTNSYTILNLELIIFLVSNESLKNLYQNFIKIRKNPMMCFNILKKMSCGATIDKFAFWPFK